MTKLLLSLPLLLLACSTSPPVVRSEEVNVGAAAPVPADADPAPAPESGAAGNGNDDDDAVREQQQRHRRRGPAPITTAQSSSSSGKNARANNNDGKGGINNKRPSLTPSKPKREADDESHQPGADTNTAPPSAHKDNNNNKEEEAVYVDPMARAIKMELSAGEYKNHPPVPGAIDAVIKQQTDERRVRLEFIKHMADIQKEDSRVGRGNMRTSFIKQYELEMSRIWN